MAYKHVKVPSDGKKITVAANGKLRVPDRPILPFIEGDGIGSDIMKASRLVWDAAVRKAYGGSRSVAWMEVYAGEKANKLYGGDVRLPDETIGAFREFLVGIKGPPTTPVGGGIRSLNVAMRQILDLYVCQRPVRWFEGVPAPVKRPDLTNMVIFRENSEDVYAGIEWACGTKEAKKVVAFLRREMKVDKIRFPATSSIGIKPVSKEGSERLIRAAIRYAVANKLPKVTLVHKGNIMKFTEGYFKNWGYGLVRGEMKKVAVAAEDLGDKPPRGRVVVNDVIADSFFQQILTRPGEYSVIATTNLNGDYMSDAIAATVGGLGMAPGANINFETGISVFEATHGTAPKYAGQDKVNPGSLMLSGEMMLRHLGWNEAADLIIKGIAATIRKGIVTYDLARLRGVEPVKCSEFAAAVVKAMR